jgi:hypothetical protein
MEMSMDNMDKNRAFWEKYRSVVISLSIPEARAEWYAKWAQTFAKSAACPQKSRTPEQITAFLSGKGTVLISPHCQSFSTNLQ